MNLENGILRVSATETAEVEATRARLQVRVEGETFAFGNAALSRSREVAELVSRLKAAGAGDDVQVSSVHQGVLTKGSRAVFRCLDPARPRRDPGGAGRARQRQTRGTRAARVGLRR